MMTTGSAPISSEVLDFLKIAFCCQIHEGYGQTESSGPASCTWQNDPHSGSVGTAVPKFGYQIGGRTRHEVHQ